MRELEVIPGTVLLCCQSKTMHLEKLVKLSRHSLAVANESPWYSTPVPGAMVVVQSLGC